MIEVDALCKTFEARNGGDRVTACSKVSFDVAQGQTLGLVGESGSGKSTIARILMGLESADRGTITIAGRDLSRPARGKAERLARAKTIQMVFQDPGGSLDRRMSLGDSLTTAMRFHSPMNRHIARRRAVEMLDRVRLGKKHGDSRPHELSGGQRQRAAIARALVVNPSVLVLDEAVSALDVSVQAQVLDLLRELASEMSLTSLFVSHDLAVVETVCDEVMVLQQGTVVESGAAGSVLSNPTHPYTRLLVASTPTGAEWDPSQVSQMRQEFEHTHNP